MCKKRRLRSNAVASTHWPQKRHQRIRGQRLVNRTPPPFQALRETSTDNSYRHAEWMARIDPSAPTRGLGVSQVAGICPSLHGCPDSRHPTAPKRKPRREAGVVVLIAADVQFALRRRVNPRPACPRPNSAGVPGLRPRPETRPDARDDARRLGRQHPLRHEPG